MAFCVCACKCKLASVGEVLQLLFYLSSVRTGWLCWVHCLPCLRLRGKVNGLYPPLWELSCAGEQPQLLCNTALKLHSDFPWWYTSVCKWSVCVHASVLRGSSRMMGGQMCEQDLRKTQSWGAGFGRDHLSGRIGVLRNHNFLIRHVFLVVFFSFAIKTCGLDPCMAETDAVPWLQSHFQQPFLVARNMLWTCLYYRNKLSGLWVLWMCMNGFCSVTKWTANLTTIPGILGRFISKLIYLINLIKLKLKDQLTACSWQLLKFLTELVCRPLLWVLSSYDVNEFIVIRCHDPEKMLTTTM